MATITAHFFDIESKIVECIEEANVSIIVVIAWFTNETLFSALSRSVHRGVKVHVAINIDEINFGKNGLNFHLLQLWGATVYLIDSDLQGLVHHKFCVIDNVTTVSGSYNWTYKANSNHENVLIVKDSSNIAKRYISEFYDLTKSFKQLSKDYINASMPSIGSIEALSWWEKLPFSWQNIFAKEIKVEKHKVTASDIDLILSRKHLFIDGFYRSQGDVQFFSGNLDDFTPLYALKKLERLSIKSHKLTNLSFLASMTDLKYLHIESDAVKSFVELSACHNLLDVVIKSNSEVSLDFASNLPKLKDLRIYTNKKLVLEPLESCQTLTILSITDAAIESFTTVSSLSSLSSLLLESVTLDKLKFTKQLSHLKSISLISIKQKFDSISLSKLSKSLENLVMHYVKDSDVISNIQSFTKLKKLSLEGRNIVDLDFITGMTQLESLRLLFTSVTDISPLIKLPKLRILALNDADLKNVLSSASIFSTLFKNETDKTKDNIRAEIKAFIAKKPQCEVSHTWFKNVS